MTFFPPGVTKNTLKAEKPCCVFHFTNFEKIVELANSGAAGREQSRSMSFASFRKGSHKATVKAIRPEIVISETDRDLEVGDKHSPTPSHRLHARKLDVVDENEGEEK